MVSFWEIEVEEWGKTYGVGGIVEDVERDGSEEMDGYDESHWEEELAFRNGKARFWDHSSHSIVLDKLHFRLRGLFGVGESDLFGSWRASTLNP